jgi:death-on-curing protein
MKLFFIFMLAISLLSGCGSSGSLAGDKSLNSGLSRVESRLVYGLIDDIYGLAAAYATGISQGHCFNDGNKRTAFQVLDIVLNLNVIQISWDAEEVGQKSYSALAITDR